LARDELSGYPIGLDHLNPRIAGDGKAPTAPHYLSRFGFVTEKLGGKAERFEITSNQR